MWTKILASIALGLMLLSTVSLAQEQAPYCLDTSIQPDSGKTQTGAEYQVLEFKSKTFEKLKSGIGTITDGAANSLAKAGKATKTTTAKIVTRIGMAEKVSDTLIEQFQKTKSVSKKVVAVGTSATKSLIVDAPAKNLKKAAEAIKGLPA